MVQRLGLRAVDPRRDGLQRHRRRPHFDQYLARGFERRRPAFLGTQTLLHY
ncbi:hypothetical protein [uncultured Sphingopyxis sp.]|uniref:hypothetical protein n=1 Tax=uncultured Sphingopyxis sp. TaxID=310581 RepID=UPI0025DB76A4|nr:hypothetical protein [uncultured Sphingopyxis sp.]